MKCKLLVALALSLVSQVGMEPSALADIGKGAQLRLGIPFEMYDANLQRTMAGHGPIFPWTAGYTHFFSDNVDFGLAGDVVSSFDFYYSWSAHLRIRTIYRKEISTSFAVHGGIGADFFNFGTHPGNDNYRIGIALGGGIVYNPFPAPLGIGLDFQHSRFTDYTAQQISLFIAMGPK